MTSAADFAVLVISHRRARSIRTVHTVRGAGYTGPLYLIVDDEDPEVDEYRARYGEAVLLFSKAEVAELVDDGDTTGDRRSPLFARYAAAAYAVRLRLTHYLLLDDDVRALYHRDVPPYGAQSIRDLDDALAAWRRYLTRSGAVALAMVPNGIVGGYRPRLSRKALNAFLCRADRVPPWTGRLNEDVNAFVLGGSRGLLFLTTPELQVNSPAPMSAEGGLTAVYRGIDPYRQALAAVIGHPSSLRIGYRAKLTGVAHVSITMRYTVPEIVPGSARKARRVHTI